MVVNFTMLDSLKALWPKIAIMNGCALPWPVFIRIHIMTAKVRLLNVDIDNLTSQELLEKYHQGILFTPNIDHLIKLQKDVSFYSCYRQADFVVCDSRILFMLSKILFPKNPLRAQITGSDFFPAFCQYHSRNSEVRVFLLGGTQQSVVAARDKINQRADRHIVVGAYSPPFGFERSPEETAKIIEQIKQSGANTLAVGVGAPKQEKWICTNRSKMPLVTRYLAVGATIEFESGNLQRAPRWMTKFGLEWLYRLTQEPKRLARRYFIDDMPVFFLLLKQRLGVYKNPWI